MITKGIITSIDYNENTCHLRLPIFEGAGNRNILDFKATICIPPGLYNSYLVDDIVYVGFEDNSLARPVVLGKLFRGTSIEDTSAPTGKSMVDTIKVSSRAVLPADTQIGSLMVKDILDRLYALELKVNTHLNEEE